MSSDNELVIFDHV